jgi:hypothetical protein
MKVLLFINFYMFSVMLKFDTKVTIVCIINFIYEFNA